MTVAGSVPSGGIGATSPSRAIASRSGLSPGRRARRPVRIRRPAGPLAAVEPEPALGPGGLGRVAAVAVLGQRRADPGLEEGQPLGVVGPGRDGQRISRSSPRRRSEPPTDRGVVSLRSSGPIDPVDHNAREPSAASSPRTGRIARPIDPPSLFPGSLRIAAPSLPDRSAVGRDLLGCPPVLNSGGHRHGRQGQPPRPARKRRRRFLKAFVFLAAGGRPGRGPALAARDAPGAGVDGRAGQRPARPGLGRAGGALAVLDRAGRAFGRGLRDPKGKVVLAARRSGSTGGSSGSWRPGRITGRSRSRGRPLTSSAGPTGRSTSWRPWARP